LELYLILFTRIDGKYIIRLYLYKCKVNIYTIVFPERKVYFQGYEPHLTKIYQRAIRNDYESIVKLYNMYGDKDDRDHHYRFEPFSLSEDYYGFLIERK